jgi:putative pyoverdin transport system ATP-binding/permease protein
MRIISYLLRTSPTAFVLAILAGCISGITSTGLLAVIGLALSGEGYSRNHLALAFILLALAKLSLAIFSAGVLVRLSQRAIFTLRMQLSRQILSSPLRRLEESGTHRLQATFNEDINTIYNAVIVIPDLCVSLAVVFSCFVYLGWLSIPLFLAVMAFVVFGTASYLLPMKKGTRYFRAARDESDELHKHLRGLTEGIKELKLHQHRQHAFLSRKLEATIATLRRLNIAGFTIYIAAGNWGNLLFFVFIGLLLFVFHSFGNIELRTLATYTIALLYMMAPLQAILNWLPNISRASIALNKVESLGLSLHGSSSPESSLPATVSGQRNWQRLDLEGITHTYYRERDDEQFVLGPIDLSFQPGELVFIVGGNGSGKTTLIKLLAGLYMPESGRIRLDGQTVSDSNRPNYRQLFSIVFSDFYLFEDLLGLEMSGLDALAAEYLKLLQLDHKVQVKEGTLSTTELSQGQRKRLALLAAYLEDRSFYVFDEWAADQDPRFKEVFYYQLLPSLKARGKTVLVISHDDRYYDIADRIIKLDYGKLAYDSPVALTEESFSEVSVLS